MKKFLSRLLIMTVMCIKKIREPYYHGFAAQLSFFYVIALVPLLMLVTQLLMQTKIISMDIILKFIDDYITADLPDIVTSLLSPKLQMTTNIISMILALWAASRAQFAMTRIANYTFTDGKSTGKGYFRERFRAVLTMFVTLITICMALVVLVYGKQLFFIIMTNIDKNFSKDSIPWVWNSLRWAVGFVVFFLVISCNYYLMPTEKVKFKMILPGSMFATCAVLIVTWAYSVYIGKIADYDIIYGSLASIAALLMWFYFVAWALCLGFVCAKLVEDTKPNKREIKFSNRQDKN